MNNTITKPQETHIVFMELHILQRKNLLYAGMKVMPQMALLEWEDNVYVSWPEGVWRSEFWDGMGSNAWLFLRNINI